MIEGAQIEVIAGAGHSPYFETPDAWNKVVGAFFAANEASALVVSQLDAHPNERAHAIAGDSILAFLRAETGGESASIGE